MIKMCHFEYVFIVKKFNNLCVYDISKWVIRVFFINSK